MNGGQEKTAANGGSAAIFAGELADMTTSSAASRVMHDNRWVSKAR
jgi:hypothetical protein